MTQEKSDAEIVTELYLSLINKGMDIRTLQMLLGHTNIETTAIYASVNPVKAIEEARELF